MRRGIAPFLKKRIGGFSMMGALVAAGLIGGLAPVLAWLPRSR